MDDKVRALLTWIAEEMEAEPFSGLELGSTTWNVEAGSLLDRIAELWRLPKAEIGAVVNPVRERIEANRRRNRT